MMNDKPQREYDLKDRLIDFANRIINVVEALPNSRLGNHIANQLLHSGTSPAPNYGEAQSAEKRRDFIHKMKIALKELRETHVWLRMIHRKSLIPPPDKLDPVIDECNELIAIFFASIHTARNDE